MSTFFKKRAQRSTLLDFQIDAVVVVYSICKKQRAQLFKIIEKGGKICRKCFFPLRQLPAGCGVSASYYM